MGKRGVDKVSQFFGVSKNTVYSSIDEINSGYTPEPGRMRRSGGGRKPELNKHPEWFETLNWSLNLTLLVFLKMEMSSGFP